MSGYLAVSERASAPAASGLGWEAASLQVMAHSGLTSGAPLVSVSKANAKVRSGPPLPWAASTRAG